MGKNRQPVTSTISDINNTTASCLLYIRWSSQQIMYRSTHSKTERNMNGRTSDRRCEYNLCPQHCGSGKHICGAGAVGSLYNVKKPCTAEQMKLEYKFVHLFKLF